MHFRQVGSSYAEFRAMSEMVKEQAVFDEMRMSFWPMLSEAERKDAVFQVVSRGGFGW